MLKRDGLDRDDELLDLEDRELDDRALELPELEDRVLDDRDVEDRLFDDLELDDLVLELREVEDLGVDALDSLGCDVRDDVAADRDWEDRDELAAARAAAARLAKA